MAADFVRTADNGDAVFRTRPVGFAVVLDVMRLRKQREGRSGFGQTSDISHGLRNGVRVRNGLGRILIIRELNDMANLIKALAIWFRRQQQIEPTII